MSGLALEDLAMENKKEVKELLDYVEALNECSEKSVSETLLSSAYVFLNKWERIKLGFLVIFE